MSPEPPANSQPPQFSGYRVDDLVVDVGRRSVSRDGVEVALPGLSFDLLLALVRAAPNLLSYDQMMAQVWQGVIVNSETVSQRVKLVRDALGDNAQSPRYITGVRGHGYRMLAAVAPIEKFEAPGHEPAPLADTRAETKAEAKPEPEAPATPVIEKAPPPDDRQPAAERRGRALPIAVTLAAAAIVSILFIWLTTGARESRVGTSASVAVTSPPSIAVLPFVDMSENQSQQYFADGMAQEIIDLLAEVPRLSVIGRTSSFSFKGRNEDVRSIGRQLGATHLVEGSVRRSDARIRVSAQLVDVGSGARFWSETYDRDYGDVLAIQGEMAHSIARALQRAVDGDAVPGQRTLRNPEAYTYYLRGRIVTDRWEGESARLYYEQALALDPNFARAQEALALALTDDIARRLISPTEGWPKAAEAARKALRLNPRSAMAHGILGDERIAFAHDWKGGNAELDQALALQPHDADTLTYLSALAFDLDRIDEAKRLQALALAIDPLNPWAHWNDAWLYFYSGDLAGAERSLRTTLQIAPKYGSVHHTLGRIHLLRGQPEAALAEMLAETAPNDMGLALAYFAVGRKADSDAALARLEKSVESGRAAPSGLALARAFRGELDDAFRALELGIARREPNFPTNVKYDPVFAPLRADPRYQHLLRLVNHPDAKQEPAGGSSPASPSR